MSERRNRGTGDSYLRKDARICVLCGATATYKASKHRNSEWIHNLAFHTECIQDKAYMDGSPIDVFRMMNIPYVEEMWQYALEVERIDIKKAVSKYLQIMGPKTQYPDFMSSDFNAYHVVDSEDFEITQEMILKWGPNLSKEDYQELENSYSELIRIQEPRTHLEKSKYIDNCWLRKQVRKVLIDGDASAITKLQKAYQDSLKDLGLDSAALNDMSSGKSLGERIKDWEEQEPTPELSNEFKDVDKIKKYFDTFFIPPILRNFGLANDDMISSMGSYSTDDMPSDGSEDNA